MAFTETIPVFPDLVGKIALVTGSSRGIGAITARYLAQSRVKVIVNGREENALNHVVDSLRSIGAEVDGVIADCTKAGQIEKMRQAIEERFGGTDLLLAFAGAGGPIKPVENISEQDWNALIAGRAASRAALAYSSAQAGVSMLARNLAQQLGTDGVRVNAIAPSAIRNERLAQFLNKGDLEKLALQFPIPRIGEPGDVAAAAFFLCSSASSWITGITLDVAGGKVLP